MLSLFHIINKNLIVFIRGEDPDPDPDPDPHGSAFFRPLGSGSGSGSRVPILGVNKRIFRKNCVEKKIHKILDFCKFF